MVKDEDKIYFAKKGSPLIVAKNEKEIFFASPLIKTYAEKASELAVLKSFEQTSKFLFESG